MIDRLESHSAQIEITIADVGSTDNTISKVRQAKAQVLQLKKPSYPAQLNRGATNAKAEMK